MTSFLLQHFLDDLPDDLKDNIALSSAGVQVTYRELSVFSNRLANYLKDAGAERQQRAIVCMGRHPHAVCSMIAVLKTDMIYVPVNPKTPSERLNRIFNDCAPRYVIVDSRSHKLINDLWPTMPDDARVIVLAPRDTFGEDLPENTVFLDEIIPCDASTPVYRNVDTDIAYILYTSGSTGNPKGVMISHLNVQNYINWAVEEFNITSTDVVLGTAPFHFDMSVFDIYCAVKAGARLSIATDTMLMFPKKLFEFMKSEGVTIWKGISSLLMYLARTMDLRQVQLPLLKKVMFAGEVFPTKYLIEWMKSFENIEFYNGYGPTEATGMSTFYRVPAVPKNPEENIPIGKACENTEVLVLKKDNKLAVPGEIGELCIRGSSLAAGYWNDVVKTKKHFVPNPLTGIPSDVIYRSGDIVRVSPDGMYEFVSRKDHQIKWMGYRIELGEVENALRSIAEIKDGAVILLRDKKNDIEELVATIEVDDDTVCKNITGKLSRKLPEYMIPKKIFKINRIPRNDRGKIDRQILLEELQRK